MVEARTVLAMVLSLSATSALACGGAGPDSFQLSAAPTSSATAAPMGAASEPLPAEEALPADEPENDSVEPTEEELGSGPIGGREGADVGFAAAIAENPDVPEAPDAQTGDLGTAISALTTSARGATLNAEAVRIAGWTNRSTSYYSFSTYMNESTGTRRSDCTGLMAYILARKQPSAYGLIPISDGGVRPYSKDFYDYFRSRPTTANPGTGAFWRRVIRPKYLSPGDIVVYKYSSTSATGTTGHTMMVTGYPTWGRAGELLVKVVDSARSGHAADTRGTTYSGPGTGTIGIKVDADGLPLGYYWRGGQSTTLNATQLVFGHLE